MPNRNPLTEEELDALLSVVEGTAQSTNDDFFQSLVRSLATSLDVGYSLVAEFVAPSRVRTRAYWKQDQIVTNLEYDLPGTPCEDVVRGNVCHYPAAVAARFPQDLALTEMGIESYFGVPLIGANGKHVGHLCVFDNCPMPESPRNDLIFRVFAARAAAELLRLQMEQELAASEQRFRDLYEEQGNRMSFACSVQ